MSLAFSLINLDVQSVLTDSFRIILEDEDFMESNKMHHVNGFMYGNMEGLKVCKDSKVLWHAFGIGTEVDMHGIYFHGNSFSTDRGIHKDSLALFPGIPTH